MTAETHAFAVGDPVVIVGGYRPVQDAGVGTVTALFPGETYDTWAKFGQHDHPFRTDELAHAPADTTPTGIIPGAPGPGGPVRFLRGARLGYLIGGVLVLGFWAGAYVGHANAPMQTVTVTRTVTHATPPVCLAALDAADEGFAQWGVWATQNGYNLDHTAASFDAQIHGHADEMVTEQALANAAAILRDEADFARIGAEQGYQANAERCREATAPVAATSTVVAR